VNLPVIQHLGNRASSLKVAEFCGQSAVLSEKYNISGRAAAVSTAFHAVCAGATDAPEKMSRLTDEEREEVGAWYKPTPCEVEPGVFLDYESAEKELSVGLDAQGRFVDPDTTPALIPGHLDFAWVRERPVAARTDWGSAKVAYVCDIKRAAWTAESPDILQLHAYGMAYAKLRGCRYYVTGLWVAMEGRYVWSDCFVDLRSDEAEEIWERLRAAATNRGDEYSTGQHCRDCWVWNRCPAYTMSTVLAKTELAALVDDGEITVDGLTRAVLLAEGMKRLADKALEVAKEHIRRGYEVRDPKTGKVWRATKCRGRETANVAALREAGLTEYIKQGADYDRMGWVKG
jgi:hypothetical protein